MALGPCCAERQRVSACSDPHVPVTFVFVFTYHIRIDGALKQLSQTTPRTRVSRSPDCMFAVLTKVLFAYRAASCAKMLGIGSMRIACQPRLTHSGPTSNVAGVERNEAMSCALAPICKRDACAGSWRCTNLKFENRCSRRSCNLPLSVTSRSHLFNSLRDKCSGSSTLDMLLARRGGATAASPRTRGRIRRLRRQGSKQQLGDREGDG